MGIRNDLVAVWLITVNVHRRRCQLRCQSMFSVCLIPKAVVVASGCLTNYHFIFFIFQYLSIQGRTWTFAVFAVFAVRARTAQKIRHRFFLACDALVEVCGRRTSRSTTFFLFTILSSSSQEKGIYIGLVVICEMDCTLVNVDRRCSKHVWCVPYSQSGFRCKWMPYELPCSFSLFCLINSSQESNFRFDLFSMRPKPE